MLTDCAQISPSDALGLVMATPAVTFKNSGFGAHNYPGMPKTDFAVSLTNYPSLADAMITWDESVTPNVPDSINIGSLTPMHHAAIQALQINKLDKQSGSSSQYIGGDNTLHTLPSAGTRTFNYPSRALNSCYQISSSKDADFHYKVDVTNGLSLTTGAQGTVTATSYTNSSCTTGAQAIADGTASQTGTLVVGLALNQISSVSLDGTLPSGKWVKITTANTVGTPSFAIRAVQSEILEP